MDGTSLLPLEGRVALVTGGNSGIGAGIVRSCAGAGAAVAINYIAKEEEAQALVKEIEADGGRAIAIRADVGDEGAVEELFAEVVERLGALDVLVSNAGIQRDRALVSMSLEEWEAVLRTNLTGAFLCAREAARWFLQHELPSQVERARGNIIFIGSVHETIPWSGHVNYAASKGGLQQLMRSIAQELAGERIRVNAVAPGAIQTPINRDAWSTPEAKGRLLRLIPYGRIGTPGDVAEAVVWLASDAARYVTGATLVVDGGMSLYPGFSTGEG